MGERREVTPYLEFDRETWSALGTATPLPLTADELTALRGLGDNLDMREVEVVYNPLSRLLNLYVAATDQLRSVTSTFLGESTGRVPYVIGLAGSVAVGKSTTGRLLRTLLARWPNHPQVELLTTDGFLLPNAELERRGILDRKGFPESYDHRALLRFLSDLKSGAPEVTAPVYSHLEYDILPGAETVVRRPDVLIVEGLNVLQPARTHSDGRSGLAVSDYFDFSVYVDARTEHIEQWYVDRFLALRETAFADPASFFHRFAALDDAEADELARSLWHGINEPNLVANILPTRGRATLVLRKGADHSVERIRLRKL